MVIVRVKEQIYHILRRQPTVDGAAVYFACNNTFMILFEVVAIGAFLSVCCAYGYSD